MNPSTLCKWGHFSYAEPLTSCEKEPQRRNSYCLTLFSEISHTDLTTALKVNLIQPCNDTTGINTIILQPVFKYIQIFKAVVVCFDLNHVTNVCYDNPPKKFNNQMS